MYIEPNTTILVFNNVPFDNTYQNTLYFDNLTAQQNYFSSANAKYNFNINTYQRVNRNRMRIAIKSDLLYDCNYLAFRNINFGTKWFYAFIKNVEYVNNETAEIEYEIDVIQTYLFDVQLRRCFIERQHTETDNIGDSLTPEPVECGEYLYDNYTSIDTNVDGLSLQENCVLIMCVNRHISIGNVFDGVYSGCLLHVANSTDVQTINSILDAYTTNPDHVIAMYIVPKFLIGTIPDNHILQGRQQAFGGQFRVSNAITGNEYFGNYKPKNKKLYTYPYNYFQIDNGSSTLCLRYEFFDNLEPWVDISGCITPPVQLVCKPINYKGLPTGSSLSLAPTLNIESCTLENYPMCCWSSDYYNTWIAQNIVTQTANTVTGIASDSLSLTRPTTSITGGALSLSDDVAGQLLSMYKASIHSDQIHGNSSNANVNFAHRKHKFFKTRAHINDEYARIIDNYFTMFGYCINKIGVPNRKARPHWTYVRTKGCVVIGHAPSDDIKKICSIYDKGITWWVNPNEVGDYGVDNTPIS